MKKNSNAKQKFETPNKIRFILVLQHISLSEINLAILRPKGIKITWQL